MELKKATSWQDILMEVAGFLQNDEALDIYEMLCNDGRSVALVRTRKSAQKHGPNSMNARVELSQIPPILLLFEAIHNARCN
jgi:hypothetical protein